MQILGDTDELPALVVCVGAAFAATGSPRSARERASSFSGSRSAAASGRAPPQQLPSGGEPFTELLAPSVTC